MSDDEGSDDVDGLDDVDGDAAEVSGDGVDAIDDGADEDEDDDDEVDEDEVDDDDEEVDGNRRPAPTAAAVLEYLVRQLVDEPDGVEVEAVDRSRGVQLEVRVAPGDMGRVIGKRGRTAQAIRTVTRAAATKDAVDVNIEFLE